MIKFSKEKVLLLHKIMAAADHIESLRGRKPDPEAE